MADLDNQTEEALGWAAEGKKLSVDIPEVSFKDAGTFVASMTPIIGDAMAAKDVYDELQKDEPNYYLAGALGGAALVGLVPGLGDAAAKAIKKGAKEVFDVAKRVEVDPNAMGSGLGNVQLKPKQPFNKTRSAYRIATQADDGKLYPLFVNASDEIPVGEWVSASVPPVTFKGSNGNMYVPSRGAARSKGEKSKATGDMQTLPDQETADQLKAAGFSVEKPSKAAPFGKVRAVASRPGFHATTKPVAHHLGPEDLIISSTERNKLLKAGVTPKAFKAKTFNYLDGKLVGKKKVAELSAEDKKRVKTQKKYYVKRRAEDQVFVEVDMADDTSEDLLKYMQERNRTDINDKLPSGGSYTYQDGQADAETWVVGGDMKVNRVLSREEAKAAQEAAGVKDLPYRDEIEEILGRKFAKGGLVGEEDMYTGQQDSLIATGMADDLIQGEEDQTRQAFAIGGLAEDVDPVSGNEVPIGSMPEEVRDDIPAQLSEGEYVVPADVVRFFGVKFFEDIRNEAKRGFADMEANGRIGGEPIGMEMAEDELPFDISELQIVDDETEEQPMMNMGGYMRGYADGGLTLPAAVTDMTTATGITSDTSGLPMPVSNLSGIEMKEYVGPNGEITYIQFINGVAQSVIPEGYTAKAAAPTTPAVPEGLGVVTAPDDNNNTAHEDMMREAQKRESIDWTSPDVGIEQYEKTMEQSNSMLAKGFSGLATVLGGPIVAGFMAVAKRHQNKKMLEGATARLEDPNVKGAEREKWVSIHNRLSGLDEDGKARNSFTEGLANLLTPDDGMEYVNGVLVDTKTGKVLKPGIANSKGNDVVAPAPTAKPQSGGGDSSAHKDMMKVAAQAKASKTTANLAKVKAKSEQAYKAATSTKKELESKYGYGLNKGGLMKKKK